MIDHIEHSIRQYHAVAKDRYTLFHDRIIKLHSIARVAAAFVDEYRRSWSDTTSLASGGIAVWANSLAHRAAKKAGYLTTMEQWHQTAKGKYKDRLQMSLFLRGLAKGGHVKDAAEKLHATPYATIEKIDPYHRQTIVFLDRDVTNASDAHDASDNKMGEAFLDYLNDYQFEGATNPDPSFYEWLEYSEFCIGTPGVLGDAKFMNPQTVSYAGHDLTHVRVMPSRLIAEQVITGPGVWTNLDTSILPASGKGPPGAAAFVWDADCNLYLHTHSLDFVHASAKQGRNSLFRNARRRERHCHVHVELERSLYADCTEHIQFREVAERQEVRTRPSDRRDQP